MRRWAGRLLALVLFVIAGILALMLAYKFIEPPTTPTWLARTLMREPVDQFWVPLEQISPRLIEAVITSEDGRFCMHHGVDFAQLEKVFEDSGAGFSRGASTISMQLVKNLYLWPQRSYVRKALEIPLALAQDLIHTKRRILELYLNIAEWGPGVYGAEAAALYHFNKPASDLTAAEAARLAVSLPNPTQRDAGDPEPRVMRLAAIIASRAKAGVNTSCLSR